MWMTSRFTPYHLSPGIIYSTSGASYDKVCGRVIGYQFGHTIAFLSNRAVDQYYVDGVSITHGNPSTYGHWLQVSEKMLPVETIVLVMVVGVPLFLLEVITTVSQGCSPVIRCRV